ncbi:TonB-dependent receptor [Sphingosinicella sp. BN140058]|uniref:TonB-dependent receptor n=1 Tax=Sphingosinicella sp. BN140058 TaxID=1892855 RepID=UPI0010136CE7|nr:TonB-dependent receptor [Sphingosinicella sp. BN140058]QAY79473.1 TonB-dependent receptor [Sphingosinicella sp. BN140058]
MTHLSTTGRRALLGSVALFALVLGGGAPAFAQVAPGTTEADGGAEAPTSTEPQATDQGTPAESESAAAPAGGDEEILVTGIRASLASSAQIKRNSALIVDSVSSEDIGKLPDVSIADSLARLPGVTAQRLEGRDQRLSIRGLGPDFSTTLLNGREQVTVGDNRGVEYDQYPAEFFRNVNVYKSADASLIAAGISGTVDLRMLRPLDQKDDTIVVSLRGQMNDQKALNPDGSRYGYRAAATLVHKFAGDTLGIAIGLSAQDTPSQNERYNSWGFPNDPAVGGALLLGGAKPYVQSNMLTRYGAVATIEWEPSDSFHTTFDALYSNFKETQRLRGIEFPIAPTWGSGNTVSNVTIEDGLVTGATLGNVVAVQRNDLNRRKADNFSLGWNGDLRIADKVRFNVDASWSHAERTDFLLETYSGTGYNLSGAKDTVRITANPNGTFDIVPTLDYSDTGVVKITDPRGWGFNGTQAAVQAGFLNRPDFEDDLKSLRAAFIGEFDAQGLSSWELGGNYSRRRKTSNYTSFFLCPPGGGTNCTVASGTPTSMPVPSEALLDKTVSLDYLGVPAMLTLDPMYLYDNVFNAVFDNRPGSLVRDNVVTENVYTAYGKVNLDAELAGAPLRGSFGVQLIHTKQSSSGQIASLVNGVVTIAPVSGSESYTNVLPSLNLSLEPFDGFLVKFGAYQAMVRARLDQLRINQDVSIDIADIGRGSLPQNSPFSSTGGNIALRPYHSSNLDLSIEKYFRKGGYVAIAGYYKWLDDFVDPNNNYLYDFSALLSALTPEQQAIVRSQNAQFGLVAAPANTGKGTVKGIEATLSLPFANLSESLDGFGVFASGAYVDSKIEYAGNNSITLPGQSKWVGTATAYFEKGGFQARAVYRYRSKFVAEIAGLSANPEFRQGSAEGILDAQIGYEFQEGPLKGLAILAQAKNITDEPFTTYEQGDSRLVRDYQRYGRDYYLGVTYKF